MQNRVLRKRCSKCSKLRVLTKFVKHKQTSDKLHTICKHCQSEYRKEWYLKNKEKVKAKALKWGKDNKELIYKRKKDKWKNHPLKRKLYQKINHLKYKYGLTLEEYKKLKSKCDNKCMICNKKRKLFIDHNHKTKQVRGLICHNCNFILGLAYDKLEILKNAYKYLKNHDRSKK